MTTDLVDALGRTTKETSPNGNITYYVYLDTQHEERIYQGWNGTSATLPTVVIRADAADGYNETFTMTATPQVIGSAPSGGEAPSNLQTLTRDYTNNAGQVTSEDAYYNLNGLSYSSGTMGNSSNYYQTQYSYDSDGRLYQTQTPNGTFYRTLYNSLGEDSSDSVGTSTANLVNVASYQYDVDGNLTQEIDYPGGGATNNRITDYWYDWRDRLVGEKDGLESNENDGVYRPLILTTYDNLDEVIQTQQYVGDNVTPPLLPNGLPQGLSPDMLRAQENANYDEQGRVYQTQVYDVNPSTGAVSATALTTNDYYDHRGNLIAQSDPGGLWTKSQYDGAGRDVMDFSTDGGGGTTWTAAGSVVNDTVLEQVQSIFDKDSNVIETIDSQRFHDASGTGPLGSPTSMTQPPARVYYAANYYDNADRLITSVDAGTNGGNPWTRPGSVPASSPTLLVSNYAYNGAGWLQDVTDPMGIKTRTNYDNLGRTTKTIQDYTDGTETAESNITTEYGYDGDNNVIFVQADEPGGLYQKTAYVYGVTTAGGNGVNSNDILSAIQHPDPTTGNPSSSQQDTYLVNALGQVVQATDRNGTVHQYSHDVLGRLTSDTVTTLGLGVYGAIRRIDYGYDSQGNLSLITSYNGVAGSIVNQVQRVYNGLGQLTTEYQSHSGVVNTSTTPKVQYGYTEMAGGANNSRLVSMTYPSTYVLNYNYNDSPLDNSISRLTSLSDSSGTLESYLYLGLATVVQRTHLVNNFKLSYITQPGDRYALSDGGDQYTGLDRFGRVIDQNWASTIMGGGSLDRNQYGYDQDSDVLYHQNIVDTVMSELYTYDNLHQLTSFARGTLSSDHSSILGSPSASQSWSPDALGNFSSVTTNGGSPQTRTVNQQNEYTTISGTGTITYDANGNITADGSGNGYMYDAWNRLAVVTNGSSTLAFYGYDGLGRRITETHGSTTTDLYYSASWQVLEERVNSQLQARYVWSPTGVDTLVLRQDSSQGNGNLDRTLYALQDLVGNVIALVDTTGHVVERFDYTSYGVVTVLNPDFSVRGTSSYNWEIFFQGKRRDGAVGLDDSLERVYSPTLMRPLQTDPSGQAAGVNLYGWLGNAPTEMVDPSGLEEQPPNLTLRNGMPTSSLAAAGYQSCVLCHGHPSLGWLNLAAFPQLQGHAFLSQRAALASENFRMYDQRYKAGSSAFGRIVVVDGPAVAGSTLLTLESAGGAAPALWVSLDQLSSDFVTMTSGGQIERPTLTSRVLMGSGQSRQMAEKTELAFQLYGAGGLDSLNSCPPKGRPGIFQADVPATNPQVQRYLNGRGGRLGGTATRQLNHRLATDLENRGFTVSFLRDR